MNAPDLGDAPRRARRPGGASRGPRRSVDERWLAGVAAGLARFLGLPPTWVRLAFLLALPLTIGVIVPVYGLLWMLLPREGAAAPRPASGQQAHGGAEERVDAR